MGESKQRTSAADARLAVDTFGGRVHVEWDPQAAVTPLGQLPFFIEFLKVGGLFEPWVEDCPLSWRSPNAPYKRDILGTLLLSVLSGHKRYAHINALRADNVNAPLLAMRKIVSEDSVRRAFKSIEARAAMRWLQTHLAHCYAPLLQAPWILDVDTTVKPLYGEQEGAVVGFNPHKPGRPAHTYHTYLIANLRLVLEVEVQAGNRGFSKYSVPGLDALLKGMPRAHWPAFIRGDRDWATERIMAWAEHEGLDYLFKLRATPNVKRLIEKLMLGAHWVDAGQGWEGKGSWLQLRGWSCRRRVVVLRRAIRHDLAVLSEDEQTGQLTFRFVETSGRTRAYEYAVLVSSLSDEILTIAQHYRDRAASENSFDELKNHWGWGGFTTHDLKRCRLMARAVALVYNWWSLFVRLADPDKHTEAITSRPLLLHAVGKQTTHAGQRTITISTTHARAEYVRQAYRRITTFLDSLQETAEQLTQAQRWCRILSQALVKYLNGRQLQPPDLVLSAR